MTEAQGYMALFMLANILMNSDADPFHQLAWTVMALCFIICAAITHLEP